MAGPTLQFFNASDGVRLAFHEWGAEHRGAAPTLVLQHGFVADARHNFMAIGDRDVPFGAQRHIVAIDAIGHGQSGTPAELVDVGHRRMAQDLTALMDHLDLGPVHLIGYGMGGVVAAIVAVEDSRRPSPLVERLVLCAVGASLVEQHGHDSNAVDPTRIIDAFLTDRPGRIRNVQTRAMRGLADTLGVDAELAAAIIRDRNTEPIGVETLTIPTLVFASTGDPLAQRPEVLARAIPGAELTVVDAGQFGVLGDDFGPTVMQFLDR